MIFAYMPGGLPGFLQHYEAGSSLDFYEFTSMKMGALDIPC